MIVLMIFPVEFLIIVIIVFFFFNDTATTEIYTLSLHDALPIWHLPASSRSRCRMAVSRSSPRTCRCGRRSEEHTSELQSQSNLVCRLLLEKKKNMERYHHHTNIDAITLSKSISFLPASGILTSR